MRPRLAHRANDKEKRWRERKVYRPQRASQPLCSSGTNGEVGSGGTGDKVAVGIVSGWQPDDADGYAGAFQAVRELLSRLLASMIFILIEGDVKQASW